MYTKSTMKTSRVWLVAPAALLLVAGCSSDTDYDFEASQAAAAAEAAELSPPQALFNPAAQQLPFPSNLLFADSEDGTLNIPISETADQSLANPQVALNQLDGFSTVAPIVTPVSKPLDPASLVLGETIRVFEVTTPMEPAVLRAAVTGSVGEITDPTQLSVANVGDQLVLIPIAPLKPSTSYMVVLTDGIKDLQGEAMQRSLVYELAQGDTVLAHPDPDNLETSPALVASLAALEGLRGIVGSHSQVLNGQLDIDPANVVLSWVFTTQSTRDVLQAVKDNSASSTLTLEALNLSTADSSLGDSTKDGNADVYVGALTLPYYQSAPDNGNPLPAISGFWMNSAGRAPGAFGSEGLPDYTPVKTTDVVVPVLMTVPNSSAGEDMSMPADGWPVTIFQHGLNADRTSMLAIADAMARAGRVVIAIDIPMHGMTNSDSPLHATQIPQQPVERTFDIDVVSFDPETMLPIPGPDGMTDPSGTHFYNLLNLANTRDNLRQAVADLFVLSASLASAQIEGVTLDAGNVSFVGHSLGGIVGTTMLSYDNSYQAATLAMPGSGIAQLLANSERYGPVINAALASNGLEPGSAGYNQFLFVVQAMIDSGDPANHASTVADNGATRIHLIEVIGDGSIPNSVETAPLSGTEPLIRLLRLPTVSETVSDSNAAVRFTSGNHRSFVLPGDTPEVTLEMQAQTADFAQSRGATLTVTNPALLQAPSTDSQ